VHKYVLPLIRKFAEERAVRDEPFRVFCVGCGVGKDVEILANQGWECYGIDNGMRILHWRKRAYPELYFFANALHIPFKDEFFDFVYASGVIEHIGVVGDTAETKPTYHEERLQFCREIVRVTKPGGQLLVNSANRLFPFDLFHRGPYGKYIPRLHSWRERFLLSYGDFEELFVKEVGCESMQVLSNVGFFTYNKLHEQFMGRYLGKLLDWYFAFVSSDRFPMLRKSFLNPFTIVLATKERQR
jgi:SAM-dependent methyltransferase